MRRASHRDLRNRKDLDMYTETKVILAADDLTYSSALDFVKRFGDRLHAVKIHSLYDQYGSHIIKELRRAGAKRIFVDLKLHDIPKTTEARANTLAHDGADIITVHASGGVAMMRAARKCGATVLAITVLTSISDDECMRMFGRSSREQALYLARLAHQAGVHGVVCSPLEVSSIKLDPELSDLLVVTPGIRSAGESVGDQKRVDTPTAALKAGADFLVVGRQITEATNPLGALDALDNELSHQREFHT